jgi:hypothetical protein
VIKAFNNIYAEHLLKLGKPKGTPGRIALPVAGDDPAAKGIILKLVDELGFEGVDAGTWVTPGVNSPLRRFTAKTSMRRAYDVRSPWRAKNENQSGGEPQTAREPLRTRPDQTGPR